MCVLCLGCKDYLLFWFEVNKFAIGFLKNFRKDRGDEAWLKIQFLAIGNLLGLLQKDPEDWFKGGASADEEAEFDAIALRRQEARAAKDWAAADAARDEATAKGIVLEDGPDGTTWRKA